MSRWSPRRDLRLGIFKVAVSEKSQMEKTPGRFVGELTFPWYVVVSIEDMERSSWIDGSDGEAGSNSRKQSFRGEWQLCPQPYPSPLAYQPTHL